MQVVIHSSHGCTHCPQIDKVGDMRVWEYSVDRETWSVKKSHKLRTRGTLTAAVLVPNQQCVVWCEREKDDGPNYLIRQQKLYGSEGGKQAAAMHCLLFRDTSCDLNGLQLLFGNFSCQNVWYNKSWLVHCATTTVTPNQSNIFVLFELTSILCSL